MALLETLSSNELYNFIIHETISATPFSSHCDSISSSEVNNNNNNVLLENRLMNSPLEHDLASASSFGNLLSSCSRKRHSDELHDHTQIPVFVQGRKKRRRKPRVCKNKEEAETQRMTHIAVERNRRKQMNEHLAVLRSLMPESYVQRGDQASIVGGAIEYVKELEYLLQSLETKKLQILQQEVSQNNEDECSSSSTSPSSSSSSSASSIFKLMMNPPFSQFFAYPQYTWSQAPTKYPSKTKAAIADIEVTLIETHANLRILSRRSPRQLSKLVSAFHTLYLTILHLNVTTINPLALYSISAKVEEGCHLGSAEDIATAVHHLLKRIEEEASLCC